MNKHQTQALAVYQEAKTKLDSIRSTGTQEQVERWALEKANAEREMIRLVHMRAGDTVSSCMARVYGIDWR